MSGSRPDSEVLLVLMAVELARLREELEQTRNDLCQTYKFNFNAHSYEVQIRELTEQIHKLKTALSAADCKRAQLEDRATRERARFAEENIRASAQVSARQAAQQRNKQLLQIIGSLLSKLGLPQSQTTNSCSQQSICSLRQTVARFPGRSSCRCSELQKRCSDLQEQLKQLIERTSRQRQRGQSQSRKLFQLNTHLLHGQRVVESSLDAQKEQNVKLTTQLMSSMGKLKTLEQEMSQAKRALTVREGQWELARQNLLAEHNDLSLRLQQSLQEGDSLRVEVDRLRGQVDRLRAEQRRQSQLQSLRKEEQQTKQQLSLRLQQLTRLLNQMRQREQELLKRLRDKDREIEQTVLEARGLAIRCQQMALRGVQRGPGGNGAMSPAMAE